MDRITKRKIVDIVITVVFVGGGIFYIILKDNPIFGGFLVLFGALVSYKESAQFIMKLFPKEKSGDDRRQSPEKPTYSPMGQAFDKSSFKQETHYHTHYHGLTKEETEEVIKKAIKEVQVKSEDEIIKPTIHKEENQNGK